MLKDVNPHTWTDITLPPQAINKRDYIKTSLESDLHHVSHLKRLQILQLQVYVYIVCGNYFLLYTTAMKHYINDIHGNLDMSLNFEINWGRAIIS